VVERPVEVDGDMKGVSFDRCREPVWDDTHRSDEPSSRLRHPTHPLVTNGWIYLFKTNPRMSPSARHCSSTCTKATGPPP
jgi:hypothetical protein